MRFMLIVKSDRSVEEGALPSRELLEEMDRFNADMAKAGVLLAGEGLHPSAKGARVTFTDGQRSVTPGPFPNVAELVAGYWLIETGSLEEAILWAKRSPNPLGAGQEAEIEVRQVFEAADFPAEIFPPEAAAREQARREALERERPRH